VPRWTKSDAGKKVRVQRQKVVRSWFFERDVVANIQWKYGSKVLPLSKDGNAVFVKQIADVKPALEIIRAAAVNGDFDAAIDAAIRSRKG
jgi:hypothetical protein